MAQIVRMTNAEVHNLARGVVTNEIYLPLTPEAVRCSFATLFGLAALTPQVIETIGLIYAPRSAVSDMSWNGHPVCWEARFVHVNDIRRVLEKIAYFDEMLSTQT